MARRDVQGLRLAGIASRMTNLPRGSILSVLRVVAAGCENGFTGIAATEPAKAQKRSQSHFDVNSFASKNSSRPWDELPSKN
jgi:hypothetical protein